MKNIFLDLNKYLLCTLFLELYFLYVFLIIKLAYATDLTLSAMNKINGGFKECNNIWIGKNTVLNNFIQNEY